MKSLWNSGNKHSNWKIFYVYLVRLYSLYSKLNECTKKKILRWCAIFLLSAKFAVCSCECEVFCLIFWCTIRFVYFNTIFFSLILNIQYSWNSFSIRKHVGIRWQNAKCLWAKARWNWLSAEACGIRTQKCLFIDWVVKTHLKVDWGKLI